MYVYLYTNTNRKKYGRICIRLLIMVLSGDVTRTLPNSPYISYHSILFNTYITSLIIFLQLPVGKTTMLSPNPQVLKAMSPDQQVATHLFTIVVTTQLPLLIGVLRTPFCLFDTADVRHPEVAAVLIPLLPNLSFLLSVSLSCCLLIQEPLAAPQRGQRGECHLRTAMVGK